MPKYFVVFRGAKPGVYDSWIECSKQVTGFPKASYASFSDINEAKAAYEVGDLTAWKTAGHRDRYIKNKILSSLLPNDLPCLTVDASHTASSDATEFRGVILPECAIAFQSPVYNKGTNNVGEFLAIVTGLRWLERRSLMWTVYSDSNVAIVWTKKLLAGESVASLKSAGTSLLATDLAEGCDWITKSKNAKGLIERCLKKWNTGVLGEIPADFGRK